MVENTNDKIYCKNIYTYEYIKPQDQVNEKIELNSKEKEIFQVIKTVLKKHNKSTTCRVAGGWVRDKLLGRSSFDIDIALDDMYGGELAKILNDELYPGEDHYGIVAKNCEKNKHLETATMKISDTWIDLVNLRTETYSESSRVPEIEIGSPAEDAKRRDITINSMYYNINQDIVEDFLNSGINDLREGMIRTPIDPLITFADDPLRILRVIRFATRFQFEIDPEIEAASKNTNIKKALYQKISNERIEKELSLMITGNKPQCAIYLIYKFNILDAVLKLPLKITSLEKEMENEMINAINMTILGGYVYDNRNSEIPFLCKYLIVNDDITITKEIKLSLYLSLLTAPFKNYTTKIGKETYTANKLIIKESLKMCNEAIKENSILLGFIDEFSGYVNTASFDRLTTGRLIRKIKQAYFHKLTFLSICYDYFNQYQQMQMSSNNEIYDYLDVVLLKQIISRYAQFYMFIETENLLESDEMKPMFDGIQILQMLKMKPGKEVGILLEGLIEKQLNEPNLTEKEAYDFLQKKREDIERIDMRRAKK